jgi:O-antigen ligase
MDPAPRPRVILGPGELFLAALAVLLPLGPRFATGVGNIYLATALTLVWLASWLVFAFAGPRGGLSLATAPQKALVVYAGFLTIQVLLHLGGLIERPSFLLRAVQLLAYMGLFATVASMELDPGAAGRLLRTALAVLAIELAIVAIMRETAYEGFLTGTFDKEHNSFAAYLVLMMCLVVAAFPLARGGWARASLAALLAGAAVCLVFSFSRTAYIAAPVAFLAIVHRRWGWRRSIAAFAALAAAVAIVGVFLPFNVRDRFMSLVALASGTGPDISYLTRLALWQSAAAELARSGFVGVGIYNYLYLDSYFVRALVETGPIGLGLFLWLLAALLAWLWRESAAAPDAEIRALALGLYGATAALLVVMNFSADMFLIHRVMGLYWLLLGALAASRRAAGRGTGRTSDGSTP